MYTKILTASLVLVIILLNSNFAIARDPNDPIVPGDEIPVLTDGGQNIPKVEPEPVEKFREPPVFNVTPPYEPSAEMLELWEEFQNKYPGKWSVEWNRYTGTPKEIIGTYSTGIKILTEETSREVAEKFILENKEFLKINMDDLKFVWGFDRSTPNSKSVITHFIQIYKNIPVYSGVVHMPLMRNGDIYSISNHFYPLINISIIPILSKEEAFEKIITNYNLDLSTKQSENIINRMELVIVPIQNNNSKKYDFYLTWKIPFDEKPFKDFYADCTNGGVIHVYDKLDTFSLSEVNKVNIVPKFQIKLINVCLYLLFLMGAVILVLKLKRRNKCK